MQVTEKRSNKDRVDSQGLGVRVLMVVDRLVDHKENLHGAHLAYTRRRTREPKAGCLPREGVFRNQRPRFGKEGFL